MVIPEDADDVRADFNGKALMVRWYANPKDSPEWWNKGLGFTILMPDAGSYGERLAAVINELAALRPANPRK